jgi:hypothetical protein
MCLRPQAYLGDPTLSKALSFLFRAQYNKNVIIYLVKELLNVIETLQLLSNPNKSLISLGHYK